MELEKEIYFMIVDKTPGRIPDVWWLSWKSIKIRMAVQKFYNIMYVVFDFYSWFILVQNMCINDALQLHGPVRSIS